MSDTQRDREERQHVIEVLKSWDGYFIGYTSDEVQEALRYAIASIETDLKYDLLYEETSGQADKPTAKNDLGVDAVSREAVHELVSSQRLDTFSDEGRKWANIKIDAILRGLKELPSVTPQETRIDFEELKRKILMEVDGGTDDAWLAYGEVCNRISNSIDEYVQNIKAMPSVTPQEPKTGHWVKIHPLQADDGGAYMCSCCGTGDWRIKGTENFCSYCGSYNGGVSNGNE